MTPPPPPQQLQKMKGKLITSVFTSHDDKLKTVEALSQDLLKATINHEALYALQAHSDLETLLDIVKQSLNNVMNALGELQDKHHSIDLLCATQLEDLFTLLQATCMAKHMKAKLIISNPSNLFQLQASYLFNGDDVIIFLLLPIIPPNLLLCQLKL